MAVQRSASDTSLLNVRKKRQYNKQILNVEQGSFTPIAMSANGGKEGTKFSLRKKCSNTELQSKNRKTRTRKTSVFGHSLRSVYEKK